MTLQSWLKITALTSQIKESVCFWRATLHKTERLPPWLQGHLQLSSGLQHCVCVCMLFSCSYRRDWQRDYVTSHPLTFLFLWLHHYTITPSTPHLLLPLLSAHFEQAQMINRDLRKHGRGMVLAMGCQVKLLHACLCVCVCACVCAF